MAEGLRIRWTILSLMYFGNNFVRSKVISGGIDRILMAASAYTLNRV